MRHAERFADLAYGHYTAQVGASDAELTDVWHAAPLAFFDSATAAVISLPSPEATLLSRCTTAVTKPDQGVIVGKVRPPESAAVSASVIGAWVDEAMGGLRWLDAKVGVAGHFTLCGVPVAKHVELHGFAGNASGYRTMTVTPEKRVASGELVLGHDATASMFGRVMTDVDGSAVAGVTLSLSPTGVTQLSDTTGRFGFSRLSPGEYTISARRLGHRLYTRTLMLTNGRNDVDVVLNRIPRLDTISVTANRGLMTFEEHRRIGHGTFLTRDDIKAADGLRLTRVLRQIPGLGVLDTRTAASYVAGGRGKTSIIGLCRRREDFEGPQPQQNCACFAQIVIDGVLVFGGGEFDLVPDINRILPETVEAIEFYRPGIVPARYQRLNTHCGVLVIHTRMRAGNLDSLVRRPGKGDSLNRPP